MVPQQQWPGRTMDTGFGFATDDPLHRVRGFQTVLETQTRQFR